MYGLNGKRLRLVLVGIVAVMVIGSGSAKADFTFGEPTNLGPTVNVVGHEFAPNISADGLELYFDHLLQSGIGGLDIWVCTRETTDSEWSERNNLGELVNSDEDDENPTLSADGLELYFDSFRPDGLGGIDLWVTRRATKSDSWGPAENLGPPINSAKHEWAPSISADGLELYFAFEETKLSDDDRVIAFYVAKRETTDAPWGEPVSLGPVINSWPMQWEPEISSDRLLLLWADGRDSWFGDPRSGGLGKSDLWYSRRATRDDQWSEPVNLGPAINTAYDETGPALSADGSTLYFSSWRPGGMQYDIWQSPIIPIVDLNSDGIVDSTDMCIIVDHWGTDDPLCDIGPMPWGDGIVDVQDLIVIAEHLFEEVPPTK